MHVMLNLNGIKSIGKCSLEGNSAPLRLALLQSGVAKDISGSYAGSYRQPIFSIKAAGSKPEQRDKFISVIYHTLQQLTINASIKSC